MKKISILSGLPVEQYCNPAKAEQIRIDKFNSEVGTDTTLDCPLCKNKGYIAYLTPDEKFDLKACECKSKRESIRRIKKSGLETLMNEYSFEKYETTESWQKAIKEKALAYLDDNFKKWFYIGGQVGCGKTFICTAITGELINRGKRAVYMLWRDEVVPLKANVNNYAEYDKRMTELKNAEVLYIDDFFKTEKGKEPTPADVNVAFELLNYRYNNPELITIISSERMVDELMQIDEAVGCRIYQRSKDYNLSIKPDMNKNMRLR